MTSLIIIVALLAMSQFNAVNAAPLTRVTFPLAGTPFTSVCGTSGTFTSGTVKLASASDCSTSGSITDCFLKSQIILAGAKVALEDDTVAVLTEASNTYRETTFAPDGLSSLTRINLNARMVGRGQGPLETFHTNIKCTVVNGEQECKVDTVIEDCP